MWNGAEFLIRDCLIFNLVEEPECRSDPQCPMRHICVYDRCISKWKSFTFLPLLLIIYHYYFLLLLLSPCIHIRHLHYYIDLFIIIIIILVGCRTDENCGIEEACINRVCQNPCSIFGACGRNANCRPINHKPECSCPANFRGNPNVVCEQGNFSPLC